MKLRKKIMGLSLAAAIAATGVTTSFASTGSSSHPLSHTIVITGPNDSPSSAKYSSTPGSGDKVQVNARLGGATSRTNVRASAYEF